MEEQKVSANAWSELLHAEVAFLLRHARVPTLHIKGPTVALWLYDHDDERDWGDVDILVPPSRMDAALDALSAAGFVERFRGVNRRTSSDHAITLGQLDERGNLAAEIDVHDRFEGIDADAERAFNELWRRREPTKLAHVDVWFPDIPTRALLIALNTARSATDKAREDLRRLVASADREDWEDLIWLARRIDAVSALRAGLELDPAGRDVVATTALADVRVSPEWALRLSAAPRTALRLEELSRLPWRTRVPRLARWIVPSPAIIRMRDPSAEGGPLQLAQGYARRYRDGLLALVPSVRALRRVRRAGGDRAGGATLEP